MFKVSYIFSFFLICSFANIVAEQPCVEPISPVSIELVTSSDLSAEKELFSRMLKHIFQDIPDDQYQPFSESAIKYFEEEESLYQDQDINPEDDSERLICLRAMVGDKLVGYMSFTHKTLEIDGSNEKLGFSFFESFAIDPEFLNENILQKMIDFAFDTYQFSSLTISNMSYYSLFQRYLDEVGFEYYVTTYDGSEFEFCEIWRLPKEFIEMRDVEMEEDEEYDVANPDWKSEQGKGIMNAVSGIFKMQGMNDQ